MISCVSCDNAIYRNYNTFCRNRSVYVLIQQRIEKSPDDNAENNAANILLIKLFYIKTFRRIKKKHTTDHKENGYSPMADAVKNTAPDPRHRTDSIIPQPNAGYMGQNDKKDSRNA